MQPSYRLAVSVLPHRLNPEIVPSLHVPDDQRLAMFHHPLPEQDWRLVEKDHVDAASW